jgi:predicted outer membrane repeat protein
MSVGILLMVSLCISTLYADTSVPGPIVDGEHWTKAGSPYLIEGDIEVKDLIIDPGVIVKFMGNHVFSVTGVLKAIGSEAENILFTSSSAPTHLGKGIILEPTANNCEMIHCHVEYSTACGVQVQDCSTVPVFEYCSISNNKTTGNGAGMHITLTKGEEMVFKHCHFDSNTATSKGGGVYAAVTNGSLKFVGGSISNNICAYGSNNGSRYGGGMYVASGNIELIGTIVSSNETDSYYTSLWGSVKAYSYGGGIYIDQGNLSITNCSFDSNRSHSYANSTNAYGSAYSYGAGIYIATGSSSNIKNSLLTNNSTTGWGNTGTYLYGAGLFNAGVVFMENCTVVFNQDEGVYNNGIGDIHNSIIYYNATNQIVGTPSVNYCNVQGGWPDGEGNMDEIPKFVNPPLDLNLLPISDCIDAGDPDPFYDDVYFPPSQGTAINDMGYTGGPYADGDMPLLELLANGEKNLLQATTSDTVKIEAALDPGCMEGENTDWFIGFFSTYGNYWLQANLQWASSLYPIPAGIYPLFRFDNAPIWNMPLPMGSYIFFIILDNNPNGVLDSIAWYDYVTVNVISSMGDGQPGNPDQWNIANPDLFFRERVEELLVK